MEESSTPSLEKRDVYSSKEESLYQNIFSRTETGVHSDHIEIDAAVHVLRSSQLPDKQLHDIWSWSDQSKKEGLIDKSSFFAICRHIAHFLNGEHLHRNNVDRQPSDLGAMVKAFSLAGQEPADELSTGIPENTLNKFFDLFGTIKENNRVTRSAYLKIARKSGLKEWELERVFNSFSEGFESENTLDFNRFACCMHIISLRKDAKIKPLSEIPNVLKNFLTSYTHNPLQCEDVNATDSERLIASSEEKEKENEGSRRDAKLALGAELLELKNQLRVQYKKKGEASVMLQQAKDQLSKHRAEKQMLTSRLSSLTESTSDIQDSLIKSQLLCNSIEQDIAKIHTETASVVLSRDGLGVTVSSLTNSIENITGQINSVSNDIDSLHKRRDGLKELWRQSKQDVDLVSRSVEADNKRLGNLRSKRLEIAAMKRELEHELGELSKKERIGIQSNNNNNNNNLNSSILSSRAQRRIESIDNRSILGPSPFSVDETGSICSSFIGQRERERDRNVQLSGVLYDGSLGSMRMTNSHYNNNESVNANIRNDDRGVKSTHVSTPMTSVFRNNVVDEKGWVKFK